MPPRARRSLWKNVICILMLKYVGRCLDSSLSKQKKKKKVFFFRGKKTRPFVCQGCCGENGVAVAGGPLWLSNASASVAAAVALL